MQKSSAILGSEIKKSLPKKLEVVQLFQKASGFFEGADKMDCFDQDIYAEFADMFKELAKMGQSERLHKAYFEGFWSVASIFWSVDPSIPASLNNNMKSEKYVH